MAVFRIERTRDYTVMSNHHLRDKALSLKSKGLLVHDVISARGLELHHTRPGEDLQGRRGRHRRGAAGTGGRRLYRSAPAAGPAGPHQRH